MRAGMVVVDPPGLDDPTSGSQALEQVLVQAFVFEPSVKAFYVSVFLLHATRKQVI